MSLLLAVDARRVTGRFAVSACIVLSHVAVDGERVGRSADGHAVGAGIRADRRVEQVAIEVGDGGRERTASSNAISHFGVSDRLQVGSASLALGVSDSGQVERQSDGHKNGEDENGN